MAAMKIAHKIWKENIKVRDHLPDMVVDVRIIIKPILNTHSVRIWAQTNRSYVVS
jgi:hypothetical protein